MITECWTPQSNHRDTFSVYTLVPFLFANHAFTYNTGTFIISLSGNSIHHNIVSHSFSVNFIWEVIEIPISKKTDNNIINLQGPISVISFQIG